MNNIKEALKEIVIGKKKIAVSDIKKAISDDYMQSGIMIINNDSTSQFVGGKTLLEKLSERAEEGVLGEDAVKKFSNKKKSFVKVKTNNEKTQSLAYIKFNDIDDIKETFARYEKAILKLKEMDSEKTFHINSETSENKMYDKTSTIIVHNLEAIRKLAKKLYPQGDDFEANKEAMTILATIFTIRAIANKGEEDKVDDIAEQLLPYLANAIDFAGEKYIGDRPLLNEALKLAQKRVEVLNSALSDEDEINCDISKILLDERLFVEMNKVANDFKDYNINFYNEGSNKPLSYIDEKGIRKVCKPTAKQDLYAICESVNRFVIKDSVIDTDEEVFMSSLMNLIIIENLENVSDDQRKQFSMAFALNLAQSMNKLGDSKCQLLAKEVFDNLVALKSCDENDKIPPTVRKDLEESLKAITVGIDGYNPESETSVVKKPKKTRTIKDIRKTLIKRLDTENKSYYGKVSKGKKKVKDRNTAISIALETGGLVSYNMKDLCQNPEEVLRAMENSENASEMIISQFITDFLGDYAESMVGLSEEEYKEKYETAKKDVKSFHKENVQKRTK